MNFELRNCFLQLSHTVSLNVVAGSRVNCNVKLDLDDI